MEHWLVPTLLTALGVAALVTVATFVPAALIKNRMRRELASKSRGRLALTYDDGPGPLLTPPLLKLLADYGAKASFFFVGFRAERFPPTADAIQAAGHELGNHTHWHTHAWRTMPWRAVRDVHQGYQTMSRWMPGDAPFRPPFGKLITWTWLAARRRRAPLSFWTHDGGDTWPALPDPQAVAQTVERDGGGVVLLHSHDRGEDRQRYVLAVTECLLKTARARGWRVCTMSEILHAPSADTASPPIAAAHAGGAR